MLLRDRQEVLSVQQHGHVVYIILDHVDEVLLAEGQLEVARVDHVRHQLQLALDGKHQEELAGVVHRVDLAFVLVVGQSVDDLASRPVHFKHDLDEVHESNRTVFDWLGRPSSKEDLLDLPNLLEAVT